MNADFDLRALYDALDEQRRLRDLTWAAVMREVNRFKTDGHPIATSTIRGLRDKRVAEGDGILQMLLWLHRTPESFVPGFANADAERFQLREVGIHQTLRFDTKGIHAALNTKRQTLGLTWMDVARQIGGCPPSMLTNLSKGGRIGFPGVMRIVGWLGQPAADFTRIAI
jgi:hypothetical protein